jgi:hypothetical protein
MKKYALTLILNSILLSLLSCNSPSNEKKLANNNSQDSTTIITTDMPIDSSNKTEAHKIKAPTSDSNKLLIRAYDDIMFGSECYTLDHGYLMEKSLYGEYSISRILFSYKAYGCSEKYGLYSFVLNQESSSSDIGEVRKNLSEISKIISYKYDEPSSIDQHFWGGERNGVNISKEFKHKIFDNIDDKAPQDDLYGTFIKKWNKNSITIKLGYYKDYFDIPVTADDGYSARGHSTIKKIIAYKYEVAYRIAINFVSDAIANLVSKDEKKVKDSSDKIDRNKF